MRPARFAPLSFSSRNPIPSPTPCELVITISPFFFFLRNSENVSAAYDSNYAGERRHPAPNGWGSGSANRRIEEFMIHEYNIIRFTSRLVSEAKTKKNLTLFYSFPLSLSLPYVRVTSIPDRVWLRFCKIFREIPFALSFFRSYNMS